MATATRTIVTPAHLDEAARSRLARRQRRVASPGMATATRTIVTPVPPDRTRSRLARRQRRVASPGMATATRTIVTPVRPDKTRRDLRPLRDTLDRYRGSRHRVTGRPSAQAVVGTDHVPPSIAGGWSHDRPRPRFRAHDRVGGVVDRCNQPLTQRGSRRGIYVPVMSSGRIGVGSRLLSRRANLTLRMDCARSSYGV